MNITALRQQKTLGFSASGRAWWEEHYPTLRQATHVPENVRPMVTRMSDQVQRIALVYAASEGSQTVTREHLEAGLAWVEHSMQTVQAVLGGLVRNEVAGRILTALRQHPGAPVKKLDLYALFSRNITAAALDAALTRLQKLGLAYSFEGQSTGGRPPTMVIATTPKKGEETDLLRSYGRDKGSEPLFVNNTPKPENHQPVADETHYEESPFTHGGVGTTPPNTKEVTPDDLDLPEPF